MTKPRRIAVVGSGPAGMYAVETLLDTAGPGIEIDVYERLPTPWGLVRAGVAPDHPEKKLVIDRLYQFYLDRPEVCYLGNVEVGRDVGPEELASWYSAVIYAVGAAGDTRLEIPGEELPGCWSAREFVAWYNGHPDYQQLEFDLSGERAVVVGNGNVALDVARILAAPHSELRKTDMADCALEALRHSRIGEVVIIGRRTHFNAAFGNSGLEEMGRLAGVEIALEGVDATCDFGEAAIGADWLAERKVATLRSLASRRVPRPRKRIVFRFLSSPRRIEGSERVEGIVVMKNRLEQNAAPRPQVLPTGQEEVLETGLVLRAIGYRGLPVGGLPFDEYRGVVPNVSGRVADHPGVYVTGWIKRGPRGIIGTNKKCARETVQALLADGAAGCLNEAAQSRAWVMAEITARKPDWVGYRGWLAVDCEERRRGMVGGRPRVKLTNLRQLLEVAQSVDTAPGA